ncbi:glycosyltransferase involved in cell wall biosynthesis [Azospirillum fermentarium]|nr:glycosyltransferase involved in cell wall biosynthesis [Azospirillum fermentarium]
MTTVWATCRDAGSCYICGIATWPTTLAYLFCRWLGRPYVAATHGGLMPAHVAHIRRKKPLKWLFYRLLVLPALRQAAAVHVTSGLEGDGVRAWLPDAAIVEIPNGIDIGFWWTPPRRRAAGDGLRLCYVGRLSREKGILGFLKIWDRIRGPVDRLTIVGEGNGDYAAATHAMATRIGNAVRLMGSLDRAGVRQALADCDFLVLPSGLDDGDVRENFGIAAAEALAAGRPLLVPRGLAWDMAEREGFGILFTPDEAGVAAALQRAAAADPVACAQAATTWVAAHCDLDDTAERLWRILYASANPDPRP